MYVIAHVTRTCLTVTSRAFQVESSERREKNFDAKLKSIEHEQKLKIEEVQEPRMFAPIPLHFQCFEIRNYPDPPIN